MKYTEGPWTIEVPCGFPYSGIYIVPTVRKDFPFHIAQIRQLREREESEANAQLIAAAPELLDACKNARILLSNVTIPMGINKQGTKINIIYEQVKAAIDSAESQ